MRLKRQQGGSGVMFWAEIVGDNLIGQFRVPDGVKIDSKCYIKVLAANFFLWYRSQTRTLKQKCMIMHDNAPTHASRLVREFLASKRIERRQSGNISGWQAINKQSAACGKPLRPVARTWIAQLFQD